jgi:cytochrome c-type biogenesis protein CcmF
VFDAIKAFYPPICFAIAGFVFATVVLEFWRGVRARRHQYGEDPVTALARLVWRNKRRWGGYVVHVGFVVVCIGVAASSAYKKETVEMVAPKGTLKIDGSMLGNGDSGTGRFVAHPIMPQSSAEHNTQ